MYSEWIEDYAATVFCREINSALDINATTLAGKWQIVGKDS